MTKRYKPILDYESIDYVDDLNEFEVHISGNCLTFREQLQLCGVAFEDMDLERLTSDLTMKLTLFALNCNSYPTRAPKHIIATVEAIGHHPQKFLDATENYDPAANFLVMSATARLSTHHAVLVRQHQLKEGPGPTVEDIVKSIPAVLTKLKDEATNMKKGRPQTLQGELAIDLGNIFKAQGGFLGRNTKALGKTPFRQFLELVLKLQTLKDIAGRAGISLNPTTMISTAQKSLEPKPST
jgi:hypothetical protein